MGYLNGGNSLIPSSAVQDILESYRAQGIEASYEEAYQDLVKVVGLYKLLLSQGGGGKKNARGAPKTSYYRNGGAS